MHSTEALPLPSSPSVEQYRKLAKDLTAALKSGGDEAVRAFFAGWFEKLWKTNDEVPWSAESPRYIAEYADRLTRYFNGGWKPSDVPPPRPTLAHAQYVIARIHGFATWAALVRHIESRAADTVEGRFERAVDCIVSGDSDTLRRLITEHPDLVRRRSTRGHGCTLLHYVSANGVEGYRQKTPPNIVAITRLLLDAGADVNATAKCYGDDDQVLMLTATSMHPHNAGVMIPLLDTLLAAGADLHHVSGRWPIVRACVANGQPDAARWAVEHGAAVGFEDAAAIGRLDIVRTYVAADGTLTNGATEIQRLDAARNACYYGEIGVVRYLLDTGFDPATRFGDGTHFHDGATCLHVAAWTGKADLVDLLLERGASAGLRDTAWNATPVDWLDDAVKHGRGPAEDYERIRAALEQASASGSPPPGA